jgi:hypothetical protein
MSLNTTDLKTNIKALLEDLLTKEESSVDEFANRLADHIETYVKTADIKYINGLAADGKVVVGTFNGNLE